MTALAKNGPNQANKGMKGSWERLQTQRPSRELRQLPACLLVLSLQLDPGRFWVIPGLNRLLGNYRSKQLARRSGYCPVVV